MQFGNPYYGDFNASQQRQNQQSNWNKGWDSVHSSMNQNYLVGRLVFSPDQITPQEIPTNGTPAIFPLNDGSAIYVKSMQMNGTFAEYKYILDKPVQEEQNIVESPTDQNVGKPHIYDDLVKRIDFLEQVVNELLKGPAKVDQKEASKEV